MAAAARLPLRVAPRWHLVRGGARVWMMNVGPSAVLLQQWGCMPRHAPRKSRTEGYGGSHLNSLDGLVHHRLHRKHKKTPKNQTQRAQIAMASSNRPITLRICRKLSSKCTVLLKDSSQFNQFAFDGPRMHHHSIVWPTPHDLWRSQRHSTRPIHWKFCRCHVHRCHADNVEPSIGDHKALCARVPGRQQICELYTARQGCTRCITFRLLLIL